MYEGKSANRWYTANKRYTTNRQFISFRWSKAQVLVHVEINLLGLQNSLNYSKGGKSVWLKAQ